MKLNKHIVNNPFVLESGKHIDSLQIAYHTFGTLNEERDNVIWVFHALTANSDVLDWWPGLFGDGCLYTPDKHFIVCANILGSPYGSTRPADLNFPHFSARDIVSAHVLLAEHLKIHHIHTAIGGSFGGNQALEFSVLFKGKIDHLILIASCARESAWGIAVHETQRLSLKADPTFGAPNGGEAGMKAARSIAMLTYRTSQAYIAKQTDDSEKLDGFKASSYMQHQGDKFVKRFDALCYYYLSKCLDTHHVGRDRGGEVMTLRKIQVPTLVIGIDSDVLIPVRFQQYMADKMPNADFQEISSEYGHDGFLIETAQITEKIAEFYTNNMNENNKVARVVMKFGGKSLSNGALQNAIALIKKEAAENAVAVVVSARGQNTDELLALLECATNGHDYQMKLNDFFSFQNEVQSGVDLSSERKELEEVLGALTLLGISNEKVKDRMLAFGELISAKTIAAFLRKEGLDARFVDNRKLLFADKIESEVVVNQAKSKLHTKEYFNGVLPTQIPVITGFIATDAQGDTITLGRNGSNYSATLLASFIQAIEVQNWTDVDGIYSASPKYVKHAVRIDHMSFREANELANFGTNVLHTKTILPLIQHGIPLRINSSFAPSDQGTLIDEVGAQKGIKAVSVIEDVALISIEGRGLMGKVGIDARIFTALSQRDISVRLISQASSERGIGFVVNKADAMIAETLLNKEFKGELAHQRISKIRINYNKAIIAIVGRHNYSLEKAIKGLRRNKIWMDLISNSISGEHISLVIGDNDLKKAVNVVHNQVFGAVKTLNLFAFGKGVVGGELLDQIIATSEEIIVKRNLKINIIGVADTNHFVIDEEGLGKDWRNRLQSSPLKSDFEAIMNQLNDSVLENIVLADNTSSLDLTERYPDIIRSGFDIVASNKKANSISYDFYKNIRQLLKSKSRQFYYETNVGAGLQIIDTLKHLHQSSDRITRIKGVFSGSLSYIFNNYSVDEVAFSTVLMEAKSQGFTEPDPREDLSGTDVGRKLIILAREIGLTVEFEDVVIESLVPENLTSIDRYEDFIAEKNLLDAHFEAIKSTLGADEVLRYTGELDVTNQSLKVALVKASKRSPLGNIKNADSIFEIYTESYGEQPIVIQGAGAGAKVTARGVYSDLLRMGLQQE
jgi:homoserine O-acetyltransferase